MVPSLRRIGHDAEAWTEGGGEPWEFKRDDPSRALADAAIDWPRLNAQLEALNAINRQADGSCCRLALSDADRAGRDLVAGWMADAGLEVEVDEVGNLIGQTRGSAAAPVMTGSHIDTVATGGRFDGAYGVLAGLEVIRRLQELDAPLAHPLALGVFTNEEGVRFAPDMMGSMVYAGLLSPQDALVARAEDGTTVGSELARIGYAGTARPGRLRPKAYVELHIEQGPILDREGGRLGAVDSLQGISWAEAVVRGSANHAGTTPMALRRDALAAAAELVVAVREVAEQMGGSQVATVGAIRVSPNLVNVIAREARLTIDLRNTDDAALVRSEASVHAAARRIAEARGLEIELHSLQRTLPVAFDPGVVGVVEAVAQDLGLPVRRMTSGAGHDAQMMAAICPAGMIFVPSIGGVSHNPREDTRPDDLEAGANVLLHTMLRLALT